MQPGYSCALAHNYLPTAPTPVSAPAAAVAAAWTTCVRKPPACSAAMATRTSRGSGVRGSAAGASRNAANRTMLPDAPGGEFFETLGREFILFEQEFNRQCPRPEFQPASQAFVAAERPPAPPCFLSGHGPDSHCCPYQQD